MLTLYKLILSVQLQIGDQEGFLRPFKQGAVGTEDQESPGPSTVPPTPFSHKPAHLILAPAWLTRWGPRPPRNREELDVHRAGRWCC